MAMYSLLEYNDHYSMTSGSSWDYHREEVNDDANKNNVAWITPSNNNILDMEGVVLLKYFSNIWICRFAID